MINKMYKLSEWFMIIFIPVILVLSGIYRFKNTLIIIIVSIIIALVPFFWRFEHLKPKPRDIMPVVVLASIASVGRIIFAAFPSVKPVTAIVIIAGIAFGRQSGFMTGALAALGSNLFFGQGIYTPWQMYAWGIVGFIAGFICEKGFFENRKILVYIYGFLASIYFGLIMDSQYVIGYIYNLSVKSALTVYGAGLPFSLIHAVSTVVFLILIYAVWVKKLSRIKNKFGIVV